jgi:hypothetical protein
MWPPYEIAGGRPSVVATGHHDTTRRGKRTWERGGGVTRRAGQLAEQRERLPGHQVRVPVRRTAVRLVEQHLPEVQNTGHGDGLELGLIGCGPGDNGVRAKDLDLGIRQMQICGALCRRRQTSV